MKIDISVEPGWITLDVSGIIAGIDRVVFRPLAQFASAGESTGDPGVIPADEHDEEFGGEPGGGAEAQAHLRLARQRQQQEGAARSRQSAEEATRFPML